MFCRQVQAVETYNEPRKIKAHSVMYFIAVRFKAASKKNEPRKTKAHSVKYFIVVRFQNGIKRKAGF